LSGGAGCAVGPVCVNNLCGGVFREVFTGAHRDLRCGSDCAGETILDGAMCMKCRGCGAGGDAREPRGAKKRAIKKLQFLSERRNFSITVRTKTGLRSPATVAIYGGRC